MKNYFDNKDKTLQNLGVLSLFNVKESVII